MPREMPLEGLLTAEIMLKLLANGRQGAAAAAADRDFDPLPVVKIFTPDANATWLLTEIDPTDPDRMFGLCDLGLGCPELGWCSLREIASVRGAMGLVVERDRHFCATKSLQAYADDADLAGRIVT